MNRRLPFTLFLLILFVGICLPANARPACREATITTWKQGRSGLATRTWHYGYDAATRLTSAILKNPAEAILKTHGWQYDPGDNHIASKTDTDGLIPNTHNKLNQLLTNGSGHIRTSFLRRNFSLQARTLLSRFAP